MPVFMGDPSAVYMLRNGAEESVDHAIFYRLTKLGGKDGQYDDGHRPGCVLKVHAVKAVKTHFAL